MQILQVGVRELLVQCVENLLRSHWQALGRGWHSALEFVAAAGRDSARTVAALALRCVAPAPAALFAAVPADCVADCVSALAAFAANPHHLALRYIYRGPSTLSLSPLLFCVKASSPHSHTYSVS
jgi:hypothetical protein